MEIKLQPPASADLMAMADREWSNATTLAAHIDSPTMLAQAVDDAKAIKAKTQELTEKRMAITRPLDQAKAAVMDLFRPALERLDDAAKHLRIAIDDYSERERQRAAAERAAAERAAAEERRRAAEAAAAAQAKAEAAAAELRAKAAKAEADGRAAQAAKFDARAEATIEQARNEAIAAQMHAATITADVVAQPASVAGLSTRQTYKAECVDKLALVQFVAANPAFLHLVQADSRALDSQAKAMRDQFNIPGCRVRVDRSIALR